MRPWLNRELIGYSAVMLKMEIEENSHLDKNFGLLARQLTPHDLVDVRVRFSRQRVVELHLKHRLLRHHLTCMQHAGGHLTVINTSSLYQM